MKLPEGKGKGKDIGLRKCFECDSDSHIAAECPERVARVAAGGPERLPKGDSPMGDGSSKGSPKGKRGVKGENWPSQGQWRNWNPGKGASIAVSGPKWMGRRPAAGLRSAVDASS